MVGGCEWEYCRPWSILNRLISNKLNKSYKIIDTGRGEEHYRILQKFCGIWWVTILNGSSCSYPRYSKFNSESSAEETLKSHVQMLQKTKSKLKNRGKVVKMINIELEEVK